MGSTPIFTSIFQKAGVACLASPSLILMSKVTGGRASVSGSWLRELNGDMCYLAACVQEKA